MNAVINRGQRSNTPNEVKLVENINKYPLSFIEIRFPVKLLESIESFMFVRNKARISGEFDSRKDSHPTILERRPRILVKLS